MAISANNNAAAVENFGEYDHNNGKHGDETHELSSSVDSITTNPPYNEGGVLQHNIFGEVERLRPTLVRVKDSKRALKKDDPEWPAVYKVAERAYRRFRYEQPDILRVYTDFCLKQHAKGEQVEPDKDIRILKMRNDWHFSNTWNPILTRMVLARYPELSDTIKHEPSCFDSEGMPWEVMA